MHASTITQHSGTHTLKHTAHYIQYHPALHAVPPSTTCSTTQHYIQYHPALHAVPPSTTFSTTQHYMQYHPTLHAVPPNTHIIHSTLLRTNLSNFSTVDPVVISHPIGANITLGEADRMISCEARGSPQPIIVWYRNDSLINLQTARGLSITLTTIHVVVHSELVFLNATFEDSGVYWCEARPLYLEGTPASSARVNITVQSMFKLIATHVYCMVHVYFC